MGVWHSSAFELPQYDCGCAVCIEKFRTPKNKKYIINNTKNMEDSCPQCGNNLKLVPSGTSKKTGKPYNSFYSCSARCGYTQPTKSVESSGFRPVVSKADIPIIEDEEPGQAAIKDTMRQVLIGYLEEFVQWLKEK